MDGRRVGPRSEGWIISGQVTLGEGTGLIRQVTRKIQNDGFKIPLLGKAAADVGDYEA